MATYLTAETIKSLREARGLTQGALAAAVGVTDKAVSKWETGRGLPDVALVEPLAQALGVSVAELLTVSRLLTTALSSRTRRSRLAPASRLSITALSSHRTRRW